MIQVGVNGYGTIGKRVADAVVRQPDMELAGVAKTRPNFEAETAVRNGYSLYAAVEECADQFDRAGMDIAGPVENLVEAADVMIDATPSGIGERNKPMYEARDTPALYQGGEDADLVDASFNARSNFMEVEGYDHVRVVSCNTTGLARLLTPLQEEYGVRKARVTLVRRGGDPAQSGRGPINDILPDPVTIPSHHGPDVQTIFPDLDIDTLGMKVPATLMHTHSVNVTLEDNPDGDEVRDLLERERRFFVVPEHLDIDGGGKLKEFALDAGRPRGDIWENAVWSKSITVEGGVTSETSQATDEAASDLYLFQAIHQESDVIPENVDAIRAVLGAADAGESMDTTDETLGMGL